MSSCIALLFQTLLYLWAAPCSVKSSSIWFQTLCCSHPTFWLPSSLPVASRHQMWATVARRSSFATDQRRLEDGKGKSVHIQVVVFFVKSFKQRRNWVDLRHRFFIPSQTVSVIVRVLFPASLGTQSSMEVSVASPSSFVRCRGRC